MIPQTPQTRALSWIKGGFAIIPLPSQSKAPNTPDWQNLHITETNVGQYFNGTAQNMGLLLGESSHWTIDIDLDSAEAIAAAKIFFPDTFTFGRKSRPRSHLLYRCEGVKTKKFSSGKDMLIEIRSTGCQTVLPGSVHPSGELIESAPGPKTIVSMDEKALLKAAGKTAGAALLGREWKSMAGWPP